MSMVMADTLAALKARTEEIVARVVAPQAAAVDQEGRWPEHSMRAFAEAGLLGLHVPVELGGHGQGLGSLAVLTEVIGRACGSSALCFAMHNVGTAVIAAKPTRDQEERFLRPIAAGEHITTLSLSETGTGVHFYLPQTRLEREGDMLIVEGAKQFVTSGAHADSFVVSTRASDELAEAGEFSCVLIEKDTPGMEWQGKWQGMGMRGNSSLGLRLNRSPVPAGNLLGAEGDQTWFVFEVVAPYFIIAMAGTYLGIAQGALDQAIAHLKRRTFDHSGESLADVDLLQYRIAQIWADVEKCRLLVRSAAHAGDLGDPDALIPILCAKAEVADVGVRVVNDAMTITGGIGYSENGELSRRLRDIRAAHVMSPTTDILRLWAGRALLGRPLL
jgi:isovaleryl-CoA dehydrogenase